MIADCLKYFSVRLALAYLLFIFTAFGAMVFGEGKIYPDYFLHSLLSFSFVLSSILLSRLGKWRFNALMVDAQECDITRFLRKGEVLFEKLLILTRSFHFWPSTAERLRERVYKEYSRFLLALDTISEAAFYVHKRAYAGGWENKDVESKLMDGLLEKKRLDKEEIQIGAKLISRYPDNTELVDLLAENCLSKKFMDYDSQELFRQALEKDSRHTPRILDMLLPGILDLERGDSFAVLLYFKAVEKEHPLRVKCQKLLRKLALPYLFDKNLEGMEKRLVDFYNATSEGKGPDSAQGKGFKGIFSLWERRKGTEVFAKKTWTGEKVRAGHRRSMWKSLLPDATFFYLAAGVSFMAYLGYQWYQEQPAPLDRSSESVLLVPEQKPAAPSQEKQKYVPFKSDQPFTLQVGAYNAMEKAEEVMRRLKKESPVVYWLPAKIGDKTWYRVRIGEFRDKESARLFAKELEEKKKVGKDYYLTNFKEGFILNKEYSGD